MSLVRKGRRLGSLQFGPIDHVGHCAIPKWTIGPVTAQGKGQICGNGTSGIAVHREFLHFANLTRAADLRSAPLPKILMIFIPPRKFLPPSQEVHRCWAKFVLPCQIGPIVIDDGVGTKTAA